MSFLCFNVDLYVKKKTTTKNGARALCLRVRGGVNGRLADLGVNPLFALLKQRYSTEASLQHGDLRDSPPGRLPQPVGGYGQQQLCAHQRRRQSLRQAEEKRPDVRRSGYVTSNKRI